MSRLREFVAAAAERAAALPAAVTADASGANAPRRSLRVALGDRRRVGVVAEFKRRSPSHGALATSADPVAHARVAARAGAAALSVLTEPRWFGGSLDDLAAARTACDLPILAKDFVVAPAQVAAAATHGADAVLLIARCLDDGALATLVDAARRHRLEVVVECHDEDDLARALAVPEAIVGVNNRDLDTLHVDLDVARRLLPRVPSARCAIAESGYRSGAELQHLRGLANGVLVGASIMRGADLGELVAGGGR